MGVKLFGYELKRANRQNEVNQAVNSALTSFLTSYSKYFTTTPTPIGDGVDAYASVTDVYSIISYIANKFSTVPIEVYSIKDLQALKRYKYLVKNGQLKEAAKMQKKALDIEKDDHPVIRLLKRPNRQQGQDSFLQQVMGFRLSGGATPIWMNRGEGQNGETVAMHCLLPSKIRLKPDPQNAFYSNEFQFDELGLNLEGKIEDLIYWRYWSPKFDTTTFQHLYGFSPLAAAAYTMSSNQEAQKAALSMFTNKGVNHIVFPNVGNEVIPQPQRDKMREDLNKYANNNANRGGVFLAGAPLGAIDMGATAGEMELIKSMNLTKQQLCNVYQFPYALFDGQTTFNNVQQAGKQLITNKIMPEWTSFADQLNSQLIPTFKNMGGIIIQPDFSMMYEMQEDTKLMVETYGPLFDRGIINGNDMREITGFDESNLPEHQQHFIQSTYQPIDQAAAPLVEDTPNSLLDE